MEKIKKQINNKKLIDIFLEWEDVVFSNDDKFLEEFCWEGCFIEGVWWSSQNMKIVYVKENGSFISDSVPISEWLEFYRKNKIKK